jgi:hypothetical protein
MHSAAPTFGHDFERLLFQFLIDRFECGRCGGGFGRFLLFDLLLLKCFLLLLLSLQSLHPPKESLHHTSHITSMLLMWWMVG